MTTRIVHKRRKKYDEEEESIALLFQKVKKREKLNKNKK